jgi:hypothetical protein
LFFLTSLGLTYISGHKTEHKGLMATPPATQEKSLPSQIPSSAPAGQSAPSGTAAPAAEAGSKAQEVPK